MFKKFMLMAVAAIALCSCSGKSANEESAATTAVAVDSILANPDAYVGQQVTIEGVVSHLCKHGGRKAFILGSDENTMIRCDATEEMGSRFPQETIHKPLRVTGTVMESRIDEAAVREMEAARAGQVERVAQQEGARQAADFENTLAGCDTERKAAGQGDLTTFTAQMADYRARIAARAKAEGKPYLSSYYIVATAYEILPE